MTLSPPHFLREGIDGFERVAADIFGQLASLRRVVVLFDECEEFFRKREPTPVPSVRTTGAFITAGMLPRLQDLRDRRWVIFVLATNSSPDDLDPAVLRPGRFDYGFELRHPTLKAQVRYLELSPVVKAMGKIPAGIRTVLSEYDSAGTKISFSALDVLVVDDATAQAPADTIRKLMDPILRGTVRNLP